MIKDATGVDLTTAITGAIRISTVFDQYANTARKIPKNIAKRNPVTIRTKLNPTDCQKFPVKLSSKSFRTTETGDARRISQIHTCKLPDCNPEKHCHYADSCIASFLYLRIQEVFKFIKYFITQ